MALAYLLNLVYTDIGLNTFYVCAFFSLQSLGDKLKKDGFRGGMFCEVSINPAECGVGLMLGCLGFFSFFFPCLHDRATVRSGAEIGLLSLRLSVSQGASLGDFLLALACPIEKVTLWECDQPGKNPLKYPTVVGNRTRATGRTDSELFH